MPKYNVVINVGKSYTYTIEAEEELEAREKAETMALDEFKTNSLEDPVVDVEDVYEDELDEESSDEDTSEEDDSVGGEKVGDELE